MFLCQIEGHTILARELGEHSVVLDLGANLGRFSSEIINRFGCKCFAVEANPDLCQRMKLEAHCAVFNFAVAATSGPITLHVSQNCEASSILKARSPANITHGVSVQAVRLDEFLRIAELDHVDLIKFDIEGAEIQVLDSCSDEFLERIPQLTIEFHDFLGLTPLSTVKRVVHRLQALGFFCMKMWRTGYGDTLFINRKLISASLLECMWARHVTRNCWGLRRVLSRIAGKWA